ncbi:MAG: hypothetical protein L0099_02200 [Acidobacteria bacterium]|nr:hypothetical protein [Acidobacteriota bacterium]
MIHPNIPRCHYIKTDGRPCGSPALRHKRFCYFHYEVNRPTVLLGIPPLEDGDSIQLALTDLARAVSEDRIDQRRANSIAYILQIAAFNLKRVHLGVHKDDMVRQVPDENPYTRNGARRDPWKLGEGGETVDAPPTPDEIEHETEDEAAAGQASRRQPQPATRPQTRTLKTRG